MSCPMALTSVGLLKSLSSRLRFLMAEIQRVCPSSQMRSDHFRIDLNVLADVVFLHNLQQVIEQLLARRE